MRTAILFTFTFLASLPAQRRWIVDVQNRPGADFTNLQTAFDAVPAGDSV